MKKKEYVEKRALALQNDCHTQVDKMIKKKKGLSHQDATNVWIYMKLAELEWNTGKIDLDIVTQLH